MAFTEDDVTEVANDVCAFDGHGAQNFGGHYETVCFEVDAKVARDDIDLAFAGVLVELQGASGCQRAPESCGTSGYLIS